MAKYKDIRGSNIQDIEGDPTGIEGQVFYNTVSKTLKGVTASPATGSWATGGNLNTARYQLGGAGLQTAALAFGGNPPTPGSNATEEYDGSSWANGGNLNTGRRAIEGNGTQTAALAAGGHP